MLRLELLVDKQTLAALRRSLLPVVMTGGGERGDQVVQPQVEGIPRCRAAAALASAVFGVDLVLIP